jgi:putative NADH-flavin reductase
MKVVVFGSTGGTGRQLVQQALAAGHAVTAFARHPEMHFSPSANLTTVRGDTTDPQAVERAIAGHDAVLCALGGSPMRRGERVCATAMGHIVPAMQRQQVRRVVAVSTFGAGDTRPHVGWFPQHVLFGLVLATEVADKEAMEGLLAASALDWTTVRIGVLSDAPPKGNWRAADDGSIRGMGKVSRGDVAAFMIQQLQGTDWVKRRPVLQY